MTLAPDEATRAIYIDFECLKTEPHPTPKLLGVLVEDELSQYAVDDALAPACKTTKRCFSLSTADVISNIVQRAEEENRLIVGWSYFDRDVAIRANPDADDRLKSRYRNALKTARPWRQRVYPQVNVQADDNFDPKHTLDKYARLTEYPETAALSGAKPATWIRHVLRQLRANEGRYRWVTSETKRDWHDLLDYNEHDCRALRHIVTKTAHQLAAWRAYERTRFCAHDGGRQVCFMAGSVSRRLQSLLARHNANTFAFVTAWNPGSKRLTRAKNERRGRLLEADVAALGYRGLHGVGIGEDPAWEPEESLMILGISRRRAIKLGREYGQLAIVYGRAGAPVELVSCAVPT
jgi:hypothetical protein